MTDFKKKVLQIIFLLVLCITPITIITGCGSDSCIRCTMCGNDDTRLLVYASGTDNNGVEYKSCVGPAGCLGFGLNTKCWPTECVSVKSVDGSNTLSGCVVFYNETGCIANNGVKSEGKYSDSVTCLGVNCAGTKYVETVADTTKATEQSSCLGISCGGAGSITPHNYNNSVHRSFKDGCWAQDK